jgi:hypothetical protein
MIQNLQIRSLKMDRPSVGCNNPLPLMDCNFNLTCKTPPEAWSSLRQCLVMCRESHTINTSLTLSHSALVILIIWTTWHWTKLCGNSLSVLEIMMHKWWSGLICGHFLTWWFLWHECLHLYLENKAFMCFLVAKKFQVWGQSWQKDLDSTMVLLVWPLTAN